MRKTLLALALTASAFVSTAANAAIVRFGGTFPGFIPTTQFSRAGADFTVSFNTPLLIRQVTRGIASVDASIFFDGFARTSRAIFVPSVIESGPRAGLSAFRLKLGGGIFDARGTGFDVVGPGFLRQITPQSFRLRAGTFDLTSGTVDVFTGVEAFRNPILNLSDLQIGALTSTTAGFASLRSEDASAAFNDLVTDQVAVPETGSILVLAGGIGLLGVALRSRRRAVPAS